MHDGWSDPMNAFEEGLSRDLRELSAIAVRSVDAAAVAHGLAVARPYARLRPIGFGAAMRMAPVVIALVVALLAALLLAGSRARLPDSRLGHLAFQREDEIIVSDWDGAHPAPVSDAGSRGRSAGQLRWQGTILSWVESASNGSGVWLEILDRPGGPAHELSPTASDPPHETGVRMSPDGRRAAFLTPNLLEVVTIDGIRTKLPPPSGYAAWDTSDLMTLDWDVDGTGILAGACTRAPCFKAGDSPEPAEHDLLLVTFDGRPPQRIWGRSAAWGARFSPDGSRIAFTTCALPEGTAVPGRCSPLGYQFGNALRSGGNRHILDGAVPGEGWGSDIFYAWSPDSRRLAYSLDTDMNPHGLSVVDVEGAMPPVRIMAEARPIRWSPDGTDILVMDVSPDASSGELKAIHADGTAAVTVAPGTLEGDWECVPDRMPDPFDSR